MERAIILLSGGIDSATTLAVAKNKGHIPYCLTFRYGQRNTSEIDAARKIAATYGAREHLIIDMDLTQIGQSALTGAFEVPKEGLPGGIDREIPSTYVPARNTIFLSCALAWAEVLGAPAIYIGVNMVDFSGYPDCRPEYINAFETMANLATKAAVTGTLRFRIETPLMQLSKGEIIRLGISLGVDYSLTRSCYDPSPEGFSCGLCESCLLRKKGFLEAGAPDPTIYRPGKS